MDNEKIFKMRMDGFTMEQIAKNSGLSSRKVSQILSDMDFEAKRKELFKRYVDMNLSREEIKKLLSISDYIYDKLLSENSQNPDSELYKKIQTMRADGVTISEICKSLHISNATYYKTFRDEENTHPELCEKIREMRNSGRSVYEICEALKISSSSYYRIMQKNGFSAIRSYETEKKMKEYAEVKPKILEMKNQGFNPHQICITLGITNTQYHKALAIGAYEGSHSSEIIGKHREEEAQARKKASDDKRDEKIREIMKLKAEGMSVTAICQALGFSRQTYYNTMK